MLSIDTLFSISRPWQSTRLGLFEFYLVSASPHPVRVFALGPPELSSLARPNIHDFGADHSNRTAVRRIMPSLRATIVNAISNRRIERFQGFQNIAAVDIILEFHKRVRGTAASIDHIQNTWERSIFEISGAIASMIDQPPISISIFNFLFHSEIILP